MARSLCSTTRWFELGIWLVALAFADVLVGHGTLVVDDLLRGKRPMRCPDTADQSAAAPLRAAIEAARTAEELARPRAFASIVKRSGGSAWSRPALEPVRLLLTRSFSLSL